MTFLSELTRLREEPKTPSEYVSYGLWLVDRAEAIEELVRAAEQLRRWDGKNPSSGIYEDFCQALEKLNKSE